MTQINIYPEDNLVRISKDVTDNYDILDDFTEEALDGYRDSERIFWRMTLDSFMTAVKNACKET